jgi:cysteine desulfurase / selenocysteine lyase
VKPLDVEKVRQDFPILGRTINGKPLVYLDSAASAQRPSTVLHAMEHYETQVHANIHRGVHTLSQEATDAFEAARERVRKFINATSSREIIFVRGTTEAINLVAYAVVQPWLNADAEILITALEHHANIVPWQLVCQRTGAKLKIVPINSHGEVSVDEFSARLNERTRLVAFTHVSNALGSILPAQQLSYIARQRGVPVLIDGAQAAPHLPIDVKSLECDFYCFSSHKVYGPTGLGVLYGREQLLQAAAPWQGGGDMIRTVSFTDSTYNDLPWKFEAGTPHIAGAVGLAAALDYLESLGLEVVATHEHELLQYATAELQKIPGLKIIGDAAEKAAVISFTLQNAHPHDIGTILDHEGIAIRTGHHCAMPLMNELGVPATARASFACYNRISEVDALVAAVHKVQQVFS